MEGRKERKERNLQALSKYSVLNKPFQVLDSKVKSLF